MEEGEYEQNVFFSPETGFLYVASAVLEPTLYIRLVSNSDPLTSASQGLELKACVTNALSKCILRNSQRINKKKYFF